MVVIITSVAQRVDSRHAAGSRNDLAIGVIFVARNCCAAAVYQPDHIALQVEDVVIVGTVALHGEGSAVGIIDKVYGYAAAGLPHHLAAVVDIICPCTVDSLAGIILWADHVLYCSQREVDSRWGVEYIA